ncbi:SCO6880 family protein [Microbacterium sp. NPDC056234]|uniref:SCO6880 family protein n=1 Tax=Microbacterium sp. NPDC056234 TaxID=3345757 RepID=UPI0035DD41E9
MPDSNTVELRPVKFSRLSRRGILLSLSGAQLASAGMAVVTFVITLYVAGADALVWTSPLWAGGIAITWLRVAGRPVIEWAPLVAGWWRRKLAGQTIFRKRIGRPRPAGTLALPGDASGLRQYTDPETGAVMIHDPHQATLTVVCRIEHPAFILLDPAEQERRVSGWGRVLATVCRSGRVSRLQVLERTLPDSGSGLTEWWQQHGHDDGSWVARTYQDLISRAGPSGERHVTTVSLSLDLRRASRTIRTAGGGMTGSAAVLRQEMATLAAALRAADLRPSAWCDAGEVAIMLRTAYDPAVSSALERSGTVGRDLATAGPIAVEETWDALRTDSAHHAVLWVSEWPRAQTYPGFLAPLLLAGGVRRSFTILYEPIRADVATRDIRKRKVEHLSDATQRARMGQIDDASHSAELQDVLQQESDLVAGHGILRYTGLVSVSARTPDELEAAVAQIEQAAIQSSLETRRLVAQQASAFAVAALPLARHV